MNENLRKLFDRLSLILIVLANAYLSTIGTNDILFYVLDIAGCASACISLSTGYKEHIGVFLLNATLIGFFMFGIVRIVVGF